MKKMIQKNKIGVDVDEVLAEFIVELNRFYNNVYSTKFKFEDYKSYDLRKIWGRDRESAVRVVEDFYKDASFFKIKPIFYSQGGINLLSRKNNLIAITSRPPYLQKETESWIEKYFPGKIDEIICTGEYTLSSSKLSKLEICLNKGIEILIEDNLKTAIKCAKSGIKSFLLDKPWNQNGLTKTENFVRVRNWKHLSRKILEYEK